MIEALAEQVATILDEHGFDVEVWWENDDGDILFDINNGSVYEVREFWEIARLMKSKGIHCIVSLRTGITGDPWLELEIPHESLVSA